MSRLLINSLEHSLRNLKIVVKPAFPQTNGTPVYLQNVRHYRPRKPFWLPRAKSKMFKFHIRPVIPEDELNEICRLYQVYKTSMKSVRQYFKEQNLAQTTGPEVIEERRQKAIQQHENCIKENDLWNAEVRKVREARVAKERALREEKILGKVIELEKAQQEFIQNIDAQVIKEKEASKSFITPENVDEAIEIALSNVVDYNYCIDLEGNTYKGRYGKPPSKKTPTKPHTSSEQPLSMEARN